MTNVLVTGANGQLGKTINELFSVNKDALQFTFTTKEELDITNQNKVEVFFDKNKFDYCINCAAYTNVDKAETDVEKAFDINANGVKNLALACKKTNTVLIHISTDFVFNGHSSKAYIETDPTNPINVYGDSKLKGENEIIKTHKNHFIIRTSWLYSEYGNNFMKTMLRLSKERDELSIVNDQIGTPTYTKDLAEVILKIINTNSKQFGIYHYSNEGETSWFEFSKAIFGYLQKDIKLIPIKTDAYPTPATRPKFSVLDKTKIKKTFGIEIPHWRDSLKLAVSNIK